MTPYEAIIYSFFFGLLHGILPDEHTWPITMSYALGAGTGREGMKAGLYFSAAFTVQRMMLAEVSYLALAPFLLNPAINGIIYVIVGVAMMLAGAVMLKRNEYPHLHLLGRRLGHVELSGASSSIPVHWTFIHGFIAGFGIGGFALFVNTVAVPAMGSPWLAFLPGMVFGLGTMLMLVLIGGLFGKSLHLVGSLTAEQIRGVSTELGARSLFFGGLFFAGVGIVVRLGLVSGIPDKYLGYLTISAFTVFIVVPALVFSLRKVKAAGRTSRPDSSALQNDKDAHSCT